MNKEFIPYKQALALKELGFNDDCFATYDEDENFELQDFFQTYDTFPFHIVAAPTFSQAFRWFRENHGYYVSVFRTHDNNWGIDLWLLGVHKPKATIFGETYEEAENACLNKLIEIVKNDNTSKQKIYDNQRIW